MRGFVYVVSAYTLTTFVVAIVWHLGLFRGFYDRIGYFGSEEPIIALGLATIVAQSLLVAYAYPYLMRSGGGWRDAARAAFVFGAFTASVQVMASAAKHHAPATLEWFAMEGAFFAVQIGVATVALALGRRWTAGVTRPR